ncbi:MAG: hypothetical protein U0325_10990 [Polyangiales bacterium]
MWRPRRSRAHRGCCLAAALLLGAAPARANGRFPAAQQVVFGAGAHRARITFRVTFGLLVSSDDGASFRWLCEEALFTPEAPGPAVDPAVEIDDRGRTLFGYGGGLRWWSPDACGVNVLADLAAREVVDLAITPDRHTVYGLETTPGTRQWVLRGTSDDLALRRQGEGLPGVRLSTVEVSPADPARVWVAGFEDATRIPRVFRSDDGGATLRPLALDGALGDEAFIAGAHPTERDTFWVRANVGLGSELLRVRGEAAARVARSEDAMLGFARSDDGRRVWYGSVAGGLWRSDDGGDRFTRVNPLAVYCLVPRGDELWACGDWLRGPFALGRSRDGGETFEAVLRFDDIAGPVACAGEGSAGCEPRWPMLRDNVLTPTRRDAGVRDAAPDASARDAGFDAGARDASTRDAGTAPPPRTGCGCAVPAKAPRSGWAVVLAWLHLRRICNWRRREKSSRGWQVGR